jgi:hypothetical protein
LAALISFRQPTACAATAWMIGGPCCFPSRLTETTMRSLRLPLRPATPTAFAILTVLVRLHNEASDATIRKR